MLRDAACKEEAKLDHAGREGTDAISKSRATQATGRPTIGTSPEQHSQAALPAVDFGETVRNPTVSFWVTQGN